MEGTMQRTLESIGAERSTSAMTAEEKKVVLASSFGALLEGTISTSTPRWRFSWAACSFRKGTRPPPSARASRRSGAGFLIRPIGALFFGRLGDMVGRKKTFLVTILLMGFAAAKAGDFTRATKLLQKR